MKDQYVIGVDYGTDSVRSVIVNAFTGEEVASSVFYYPRWKEGLYCNASKQQFRQHPLDYIEGLQYSIIDCSQQAGPEVMAAVKAISVDTTGSTPIAVDKNGTPLCLLPEFAENPNAMFVLWKDHTAVDEAAEINEQNKKSNTDFLQFVGGIYSSEWFWAKLLHVLRSDDAVAKACHSWVEHCDWIPFLLTGGEDASEIKRGVCAAGPKALWADEFGGLPSRDFLGSVDPLLERFSSTLFTRTYTSDQAAGTISPEWADKLGLPATVLVGIGAFDAHMGAVGGQIEPYHLSKVMGTSTCDMLVVPHHDIQGKMVRGICGQVNGSIIPGMIGLEAGQSAFGDAYAWFKKLIAWPVDNLLKAKTNADEHTLTELRRMIHDAIIPELSKRAAELPLDINSEVAIDWLNGRRTPDANQLLKGAFTGLDLASDAPRMFRALAEATCFGARRIVDRFNEQGVPVQGLIGVGGVARKSPFIMQMMAYVLNMPINIHRSEQTCAAGAAMFAATVAGIYPKVEDAMKAMGRGFDMIYSPSPDKVVLYEKRYKKYLELGAFVEKQAVPSKKSSFVNE